MKGTAGLMLAHVATTKHCNSKIQLVNLIAEGSMIALDVVQASGLGRQHKFSNACLAEPQGLCFVCKCCLHVHSLRTQARGGLALHLVLFATAPVCCASHALQLRWAWYRVRTGVWSPLVYRDMQGSS